ncbi:flagellar basal body-associated FliL family protein [Aeromonas enteropelogenes]|uniref:flagellar basal body-associated FliL family protein n=1 Tax=Aeromonas enteropelogenes TaxID=29489 RepID=UPI00191CC8FC|nr:flagellar basal body-associated FliL family protein [Aeromonas enteropelogenes]MBL0522749.1 flagellar basal body-associated protein FliL [Aeromonas enteropelogenes]
MKIFKILLVLLLSVGALQVRAADEEPAAEGAEGAAKPGFAYHALDPDIITNYLSNGKTLGYVRVTVELMAENDADLKLLEQHDPLIRDAIIRLMGSKNADQIKSLVSREELRKECETKVNELLLKETGKKAVRELIFTKFLYQ